MSNIVNIEVGKTYRGLVNDVEFTVIESIKSNYGGLAFKIRLSNGTNKVYKKSFLEHLQIEEVKNDE